MSVYAPIIVFCYKRPHHLRKTLNGLMACTEFAESPIIVFCDGPRSESDRQAVAETRNVVREMLHDKAEVHFSDVNRGLAKSIIAGVSDVIARFGRAIIVEDDLFVSPHFLRYMNDGLETYKDDEKVASIHGYLYPVTDPVPETFFMLGANCWGWATWARAWQFFEESGTVLADELKRRGLVHRFNLDGSYPYYRMLLGQISGRNNSWAIRWHAATYLAGMLTLYPGRTLVENIGMDGSGENCNQSIPALPLSQTPVPVERIELIEDATGRAAVIKYMRYLRWHLWRGRARRILPLLYKHTIGRRV